MNKAIHSLSRSAQLSSGKTGLIRENIDETATAVEQLAQNLSEMVQKFKI